jgi:Fe-S-cluster containining protein
MKRKPGRPAQPNKAARDSSKFRVTGEDLDTRRRQRLGTLTILQAGRTPLQISQIAAEAETLAEDAVTAAVTRQPPRPPLACVEGCAWCCYKRVGVAVPEVARIVDYLRATLSTHEIEATLERIQKTLDERRRSRSPDGMACPLLVNSRCSAYPVRPLTCRGFNSSDPNLCEASVTTDRRADVPIYPPQLRLTNMVLDGMRAGLTQAALKGELLELAAALQIVLTVPDAVVSWLDGKPVFAAARMP